MGEVLIEKEPFVQIKLWPLDLLQPQVSTKLQGQFPSQPLLSQCIQSSIEPTLCFFSQHRKLGSPIQSVREDSYSAYQSVSAIPLNTILTVQNVFCFDQNSHLTPEKEA